MNNAELIDDFDGQKPKEQRSYFENAQFDNIWFLNGLKTLTYDGNSNLNATYSLHDKPYDLFLSKQKEEYGILEYNDEDLQLNELLSPKYDSIIFTNYYYPILLKERVLPRI